MKELVEVIAKSLVDYPEQVTVDEIVDGNHVLLKLRVASADMGKVIGKQGRIAKACENLVTPVNSTNFKSLSAALKTL